MSFTIKYNKGEKELYPDNHLVRNWRFEGDQESEALLCHYMAEVAEKNGISVNDLHHLFPAVLRMLCSDIEWAGQRKKELATGVRVIYKNRVGVIMDKSSIGFNHWNVEFSDPHSYERLYALDLTIAPLKLNI